MTSVHTSIGLRTCNFDDVFIRHNNPERGRAEHAILNNKDTGAKLNIAGLESCRMETCPLAPSHGHAVNAGVKNAARYGNGQK